MDCHCDMPSGLFVLFVCLRRAEGVLVVAPRGRWCQQAAVDLGIPPCIPILRFALLMHFGADMVGIIFVISMWFHQLHSDVIRFHCDAHTRDHYCS